MNPLKKYLTINAAFSGLTGLNMLLFSDILQAFFGFSQTLIFPIIGGNLLFFAGFVFFTAHKQLANKNLVRLIVFLDYLWVTGSLAIVSFQLFGLSEAGYISIFVVALWIAFLAFQQNRHNRD